MIDHFPKLSTDSANAFIEWVVGFQAKSCIAEWMIVMHVIRIFIQNLKEESLIAERNNIQRDVTTFFCRNPYEC